MTEKKKEEGARPAWRRFDRMFVIRLVALIIVFAVLAVFSINRMIFPCRRSYSTMPDAVKLKAGNGIELALRYLANPMARYTVLFNHGNYEDLGTLADILAAYRSDGFAVVAWDYRGYGISGGRPNEANVLADAQLVYDYMVSELKIAPETIIVHGRSVGSGPACDLAVNNACAGLIIESGFKSAFSTVLPWAGLPGDRFINIDKIGDITCPKLFIHGHKDNIVAFEHAQTMFDKATSPKFCLWLDKAGHNDILWLEEDKYRAAIKQFAQDIEQETSNK
ncbi:MAG: alpha/beta hydrolase [Sedimentisphaerales bacterium]|nr:alpha/beta hydrolase [Sedimentisphaerales bacterium]MBN2842386.1 alpha/beta hydrolase [Sedimentisphaerales bacterium]